VQLLEIRLRLELLITCPNTKAGLDHK